MSSRLFASLMELARSMEMATLLLGANVAWAYLARAGMSAAGVLIFDLPKDMLPQWYTGLGAIAIAATALILSAALYLGLEEDEPASDAHRPLPGLDRARILSAGAVE